MLCCELIHKIEACAEGRVAELGPATQETTTMLKRLFTLPQARRCLSLSRIGKEACGERETAFYFFGNDAAFSCANVC